MSDKKLGEILKDNLEDAELIDQISKSASYSQLAQNLTEPQGLSPLYRYDWSNIDVDNSFHADSEGVEWIELEDKKTTKTKKTPAAKTKAVKKKNFAPSPTTQADAESNKPKKQSEKATDKMPSVETPVNKIADTPAPVDTEKGDKETQKPKRKTTRKKTTAKSPEKAKTTPSKTTNSAKTKKKSTTKKPATTVTNIKSTTPVKNKLAEPELDAFTQWLNSLDNNIVEDVAVSKSKTTVKKRKSKAKSSKSKTSGTDKIKTMIDNSIKDKDNIATESLALLYEEQEYYDKAIEVYENLSLKFPEKSIYFADQIEKLKAKLQ